MKGGDSASRGPSLRLTRLVWCSGSVAAEETAGLPVDSIRVPLSYSAPCPMPTWLDRVLETSQLIWLWPWWPDLSLLLEFQTHGPFKYFPSPREYMPATNSASPSRNIAHARLACAYASWTVRVLFHQQITHSPSPPPSPPQDQDWLASWRSSASASATATAEAPYPLCGYAPQLSSGSTRQLLPLSTPQPITLAS
jgi:hypothetical protein